VSGKKSLTQRLGWSFGGFFVLLALIAGATLYALLSRELHAQRNLMVQDRMDAIGSLLKSPAHGLDELHRRVEMEWPLRGGEKLAVRIWDGEGREQVASPRIPANLADAMKSESLSSGKARSLSVPTADGDHTYLARVEELENTVGLTGPVRVAIAVGDAQTEEFLKTLRFVLIAVFLTSVVGSLLFAAWLLRREMRPLEAMASQIAAIDSERLHARLDVDPMTAELALLAGAFNHTLDRLEASFDRLTRFSSDIAHELRTPVANIRGIFEVVLSRPRSGEEYTEAIESSLEECERISKITESLLFLARTESLQKYLTKAELDPRAEIAAVLDFLEASASEKNIELILESASSPNLLYAEPTLFQRVIVNLVTNAIRYTNGGGQVRLRFHAERGGLRIEVSDNGNGIPARNLPFVFERFYRVDPSRHVSSGGAGLGLAIVKSIVKLHGGDIAVTSDEGVGTTFSLWLPGPATAARPERPPAAFT